MGFEAIVRIFNIMDKVFNIGYFIHYVRYRTDCKAGNIQAAICLKNYCCIFYGALANESKQY